MRMEELEKMINGYGTVLRIITPLMTVIISVLVTIMLFIVANMNARLEKLDAHFTNHLMHHQDLEVGYERRLTAIEGNSFTDKDARALEVRIKNEHDAAFPPKWLVEKVAVLERKTEVILDKIEKMRRR